MRFNFRKNIWYFLVFLCLILIIGAYKFRVELRYIISSVYYAFADQSSIVGYKRVTAFGIGIPRNFEVHGIDVSKYQGNIQWEKLAKVNDNGLRISFAYIKATEGSDNIDSKFARNWKNARKNNIVRGAYHFYNPNVNSAWQAKNFIRTVKLSEGDLPPVLDIEITGRYPADNTRKGIKNWLRLIEAHYKVKPVIYTSLSFYLKYLNDDVFSEYPFWIAHYYKHRLFLDRSRWTFWQHSDKGRVDGITGKVDFNVFNGTREDLNKLCVQ